MNKTEKLLAARKKLKEFQQHKQTSHHDPESHPQNTIKDNNVTNDKKEEIYMQNNEIPTTPVINNVVENVETEIQENLTKVQMELIKPDENISKNLQATSTNEIIHEIPQVSSNMFDVFKFSESKNEDDIFSKLKTTIENGNIDENDTISQNGSINNSPSLQKQHLLQMASDVANALVENEENKESTTIHSDLEYRNQFLTTCLEEQKRLVNQLHVQVSQYSSKVSELETLLATKNAEFEAKLLREVNPLKEQLQIHAQTTGILVAEKAELTSVIAQYQNLAKKKSEEVDELCGKLKNTQLQLSEMEKKHLQIKVSGEDMQKMYHQMQADYLNLEKKYTELKKDKEEQQMETAELRQDLNLKNTELSNLQREYQEKKNLLSLAELKIQQLTNIPEEMQALEGQHQAQTVLEQQLSQLRETLKSVNSEKEETCKHYENYVQQLDSRYEKVVEELEITKIKIKEVEEREESYIQRLSVMEQQYQKEKQKVESLQHLESHDEKIQHLTKSMDSLVTDQENLQLIIQQKDAEIESMKEELEKLRELQNESVDTSKLVTALESEQLGASRAVSQNQQLKSQLSEMHDAFVTLSNSKLDLTEKLQGERAIGKKLNAHLNQVEIERDELKKELKKKEEILNELEKEKLQSAQIADQMQHYQAQSSQARTLQQELQNALLTIEDLNKKNELLHSQLVNLREKSHDEKPSENGNEELIEVGVDIGGFKKETTETEVQTIKSDDEIPDLLTSEPVKKLEIRFKETMEKVAELTDEKQRLEHLVLQLQGETETIGEYITLYQKQRAILQQKAQDKEQTFSQLIEQRNQQQVQLHQLKVLVADLLKNPSNNQVSSSTIPQQNEIITPENQPHGPKEHIPQEMNKTPGEISAIEKNETKAKILDLLTEIKDCQDTCSVEPTFHPCLWCSGKLITV